MLQSISMSAESNRRLENLIRLGKIKTVNPSQPIPTVTVDLVDMVTDEIRFITTRSGKDKTWDPPSIGEEVIVFSPCGELGLGIAIGGFYNDANPAPSADPNLKLRMFEDGCVISYDIATHHLSAILPGGGQATLTADGGVTVNGDTTINGNLQVTGNNTVLGSQSVSGTSYSKGNFNTDGDVNAGGISLKTHTHSGVQTGGGNTGGPQ